MVLLVLPSFSESSSPKRHLVILASSSYETSDSFTHRICHCREELQTYRYKKKLKTINQDRRRQSGRNPNKCISQPENQNRLLQRFDQWHQKMFSVKHGVQLLKSFGNSCLQLFSSCHVGCPRGLTLLKKKSKQAPF